MSFECFFLFWICRVYCKAHKLEEGISLLFLFPSFRVVCLSLFSPSHHGVKLMNLSRASTKQIKTHYISFIPCIDVNGLAKGSFVMCIFWMMTWTMCMMDIGIQCGYTFQDKVH
jgi:hypothetical protein